MPFTHTFSCRLKTKKHLFLILSLSLLLPVPVQAEGSRVIQIDPWEAVESRLILVSSDQRMLPLYGLLASYFSQYSATGKSPEALPKILRSSLTQFFAVSPRDDVALKNQKQQLDSLFAKILIAWIGNQICSEENRDLLELLQDAVESSFNDALDLRSGTFHSSLILSSGDAPSEEMKSPWNLASFKAATSTNEISQRADSSKTNVLLSDLESARARAAVLRQSRPLRKFFNQMIKKLDLKDKEYVNVLAWKLLQDVKLVCFNLILDEASDQDALFMAGVLRQGGVVSVMLTLVVYSSYSHVLSSQDFHREISSVITQALKLREMKPFILREGVPASQKKNGRKK